MRRKPFKRFPPLNGIAVTRLKPGVNENLASLAVLSKSEKLSPKLHLQNPCAALL
jgi:hypothetical protein